jgi:glycine/D-amino acid oxidase-like deaminating enzyme
VLRFEYGNEGHYSELTLRAQGGFLWANRETAAIAGLAKAAGASFIQEQVVDSDGGGATLASGTRIHADAIVLAAGAWTAGLIDVPIRATRQLTVYLAGGPADIPVFGDGAPFAMYGIPAHDGLGMMIGAHLTGPDGRVVCAGFSGHGFKFAPVVAAAAAEFALGRPPSVDLGPFRLTTGA